jgi:hypothetical protein
MTGMLVIRRLVALVLAAALMLAAATVLVEIAAAALDRPPWIVSGDDWVNWLGEHRWDDGVIRAILSGILLSGLLLLIVGLYRGRPAELALVSAETGVTVTVSRRGVERTLTAAARSVPGITSARTSTRRRGIRVDAWTRIHDPGDLRDRVEAAVQERIGALEPRRPPQLTVRVRTEDDR